MKPILFSTEMVQAIDEDRKTKTRRVIKPQPSGVPCGICTSSTDAKDVGKFGFADGERITGHVKPKYQVGDILWVRETFENYQGAYNYKAGKYGLLGEKWKPSIFMPKEAARIFLRVTDLRLERLQDISEEDAIAEGIMQIETEFLPTWAVKTQAIRNARKGWKDYMVYPEIPFRNPKNSFESLWVSINGEESWNDNPYVWVICFERIENGALN